MMKKILLILVVVTLVITVKAQQTASSDHYETQQYFVNPAAAGMNGASIFLGYRRQWAGFTGAPETEMLAVDGAVKKDKIGLGLLVVNDQQNILGSTSLNATFAYRIKFGENHFLRLGLSGGMNQNRILFDKIIADDPSELQVFRSNQSATSFDAGAGLFYSLGQFKLGFACAHLFGENFYYENNFTKNDLKFQNIRHYFVNAEYRFNIKKGKWGLTPSVQFRTAEGMKALAEGGLTWFYKKEVWLAVKYADELGYTVIIGGVIAKNIVAGYAYTLSSNAMAAHNNGTHDIILGFRFGNKAAGSAADQQAIEELKKKNNELYETTDYLKQSNEALKKELEEQKRAMKESIYGLDSLKKIMQSNQEELKGTIKDNREKFDNYPEANTSNKNQITPATSLSIDKVAAADKNNSTSNAIKRSVAKETSNTSDDNKSKENVAETGAPGRIYIVVGAFKTLPATKEFQNIVLREYKEETKVVKSESETWYFIYTKSFDDKEEANKEIERTYNLDSKHIFTGIPWPVIIKK